ncbi:glycosyltransferase family protein [Benzoatithermus flavus]|uniref:Glycosyltransferase n=1 Tax=Benzoatithermus flavus TaxID=3108223 RepID=A0ABU8XQT3_9PROT
MDHGSRLLIYSHDSFGLGHLRRCRTIAHHLVDRFKHLSVLILSGSPIIGSFDFRSRVDFVRVPGVIKLKDGGYTSLKLRLGIDEMLEIRRSIIHHTAEMFAPDVFLVDKEPLGLRGEVRSTLELLKARGTRCILGLRDVMDEPASLVDEWQRKTVFPALAELYDEIWVYGLPQIFDPLAEIPGMAAFADKVRFTGYLRRTAPDHGGPMLEHRVPEEPFILVTPGGGGDGAELIDWVIGAYESDPAIPWRAVILFGPFMPVEQRLAFQERVARDPRLVAITFEARVESLFERASGVVAMGGYNTFCEILSFGKPALLVPRTTPRLEQYLRAERAQALGLVRMLPNDGTRSPARMAACLEALPDLAVPGEEERATMLQGLDRIADLIEPWLAPRAQVHELRRSRYA